MRKTTTAGMFVWMLCLGLLIALDQARADTWGPPSDFDAYSAGSNYMVRITPKTRWSNPKAQVFRINDSKKVRLWQTKLSNDVAPLRAFLSEDGEHLVTTDNWGAAGYGEDTVAIYGRKGLKAKYSLEDFAPAKTHFGELRGKPGSYGTRVQKSTSSIRWHSLCLKGFLTVGTNRYFSVWLDWDDRWVAWRLTNGSLAEMTPALANGLTASARVLATQQMGDNRSFSEAMVFLSRQRRKEDAPLFQRWLRDTAHTGSGAGGEGIFWHSHTRALAEDCLDYLEKGVTRLNGDVRTTEPETYSRLGILKLKIRFPEPPNTQNAMTRIYLVPEEVGLNRWNQTAPEHVLAADLRGWRRSDMSKTGFPPIDWGHEVNFTFYGVTPGPYRIKAIWDKAAPITPRDQALVQPGKGDFESLASPLVTVRAGKTTEAGLVECTSPISSK